MEEKVIKAATVIITAISIIVAGTLLFFPQLHIRAEENRELLGPTVTVLACISFPQT